MHAVIWSVAGQRYAIDSRFVVEIIPLVTARPIPLMPAWLLGLINFRGTLAPLIDVRAVLGQAPAAARRAARILVLCLDPADPAGERIAALVDEVVGAERLDLDHLASHFEFDSASGATLGPVVLTGGDSVQVLALDAVFTAEQRTVLRQVRAESTV